MHWKVKLCVCSAQGEAILLFMERDLELVTLLHLLLRERQTDSGNVHNLAVCIHRHIMKRHVYVVNNAPT